MRKLIAAGAAGLLVAVGAVGTAAGSGASQGDGSARAAQRGATVTVNVRDNYFSPRALTVKRNTTVRFVWRGRRPHNVRATGAARFQYGSRTRGSVNRRMTKTGTYRIVCDLHEGMQLTLRVRR
jgi:plastocyanin